MLTGSFISAALAATFAWTVSAAAMPLQARDDGCSVYGTQTLGFNASDIGIYSDKQAARYVKYYAETQRFTTAPNPPSDGESAVQFVFNNCSYTPSPYPGGKDSIDSWQGYIQAHDESTGKLQCLTASVLYNYDAVITLADCKVDASQPGGVDATQHFQWQSFGFDYFLNVLFLGQTDGKSTEQQFKQGDQYHWSLENETGVLLTSYKPTSSDAKENPSEYLIAKST